MRSAPVRFKIDSEVETIRNALAKDSNQDGNGRNESIREASSHLGQSYLHLVEQAGHEKRVAEQHLINDQIAQRRRAEIQFFKQRCHSRA